jgi:Peptidase family S41
MRTLEDVHPNLYANRSRDAVAADRARIVASLPPTLSRSDFWLRLGPFVAAFGDGHTSVAMPREEVRRLQAAGALVFPPSVVFDDASRLAVSAPIVRDTPLGAGDRLISVNGMSADSLVRAWTAEVSGESERYRAANVATAFRDFLIVHSIIAPYTVVSEGLDGVRRTVTLAGISQDALRAIVGRNATQRTSAVGFTYQVLSPHTGYMDFRSMGGDLERFKPDIADMFRRVAADSDRVLIVDLRANGGGDSRLGDEFLRYITTTPYRMSAAKEWKMSAEYRAYLKTAIRAPLSWIPLWEFFRLGRELMNGPDGKIVTLPESAETHNRAEPFFSGAVCVLIGPQTFSSAIDLSDAIKTYHLATLIGEETGGRPNGFGEAYFFRLPRSQLAGSVSSALFVRASGDTTDHRGVVPNVVVVPTDEDRRVGRDAVLERAKECGR